jgi:hypothetical protein
MSEFPGCLYIWCERRFEVEMVHFRAVAELLSRNRFLGLGGEVVELAQHNDPGDVESVGIYIRTTVVQICPELWRGDGREVRGVTGGY